MRSCVIFFVVCMAYMSSVYGQLQYRRPRHASTNSAPGDVISLVQVNTKADAKLRGKLNPKEIMENMQKIEKLKGDVLEKMSDTMKAISNNENKFAVMKKEKLESVRRFRERKKMNSETTKLFEESTKMAEMKRRLQVNKCLNMIKGGANRLYWSLRKMFAEVGQEKICPLLKGFNFPKMAKHGYTERFFKKYNLGQRPDEDGTSVVFFDAVKINLWRCMCTEHEPKLQFAVKKNPGLKRVEKEAARMEDRSRALEKKQKSSEPEEVMYEEQKEEEEEMEENKRNEEQKRKKEEQQ
eukprot:g1565.t1